MSVFRVTSDWDQGSVTWNTQPQNDPNPAATTDATYNWHQTPGDAPCNPPPDDLGYTSWNIKDLAQGWVDGAFPNYGIALTTNATAAGLPRGRLVHLQGVRARTTRRSVRC